MKKTIACVLCTAMLWLTVGCDVTPLTDSGNITPESTADTTATDLTTTTTASVLTDGTTATTSTVAPQSTAETTEITTTETTTMTTTARFPAESSDYGRSDEPHPLNFTYMFTTEGIGLRIEGGNYQTLHYALSKETAAYLAENYIIQDCNFDGNYDLLLPVKQVGESQTYALFLWDAKNQRYTDSPIELINPRFRAENHTVHSRVKGSEVVYTYEIYQWADNTLQRVAQHIVNLQANTVTSTLYTDGSITQHDVQTYDDAAKLQAFLNGL